MGQEMIHNGSMSRLITSSFEENGVMKYGLFEEGGGSDTPYSLDWKPLAFDTEEEAEARLAALAAERAREDAAEPFTPEQAKLYAESHRWKFAVTYAASAPHEYCVKKWLAEEDRLLYERFVATIRAYAVTGFFYGHKNDYLILGSHYYWFMPLPDNVAADLVNRTTTDHLEYRDGAYYYKR